MAICSGITKDGSRCSASVPPGVEHCYNHDPARAEERRRQASNAGKSRTPRIVRELHQMLEDVTQRVVDGELKPYLGMSVSQLINTRIALLRFEKNLAEQQEVIERLERLEEAASQAAEAQGQSGRSGRWGV